MKHPLWLVEIGIAWLTITLLGHSQSLVGQAQAFSTVHFTPPPLAHYLTLLNASTIISDVAPVTYAQPPDANEINGPSAFSCNNVTQIPTSECNALVALYNSTNGANWTNHTNWLNTSSPCSWFGVTCTNNRVTSLMLLQNQLSGSLPPELGNLTSLTIIQFCCNQLTGNIPAQLGNLTKLTNLTLSANQLSGNIPPQLGNLTSLTDLTLGYNQLSGSLPTQLGNLTHLTGFSASANQFSGSVPTELGNLVNLTYLLLNNNSQLSGPLPSNLVNLTQLNEFWFDQTQLCEPPTSTFQAWLAAISNLARTGVKCNTPPVANAQSVTTVQNIPLNITLTATDADGDPLTYGLVSMPSHGALSGSSPNLTYIPSNGFNGTDSFTFKANDGKADSNIATINIIIALPNYTLTVNKVGNGTVKLNPPGGVYAAGMVVQLKATPDAGFTFTGWSGAASGNANPLAVTMDANKNVTANFDPTSATNTPIPTVTPAPSTATPVLPTNTPTPITSSIIRVSVASDGSQANLDSYYPVISANGRYIAFTSDASNLVSNDTNGVGDTFVHDLSTGQTTRVSVASTGTQGNDRSIIPSISADGRYIAFQSLASTLVSGDTNGNKDIFVRDQNTNQTTRVSVAANGTQANNSSSISTFFGNGRYVVFQSWASNLVNGDTNNFPDIFIRDLTTGENIRVPVASSDEPYNYAFSISADGRYVAFPSDVSNLVAGDTNGVDDIFIYDRNTSQIERVSVASNGTQGNGYSFYPSISADGRYVSFLSLSDNLVSGDTNNVADVFVHDRSTGQTTRVSVASDGTQSNSHSFGNELSIFQTMSADGRYIAFQSDASNLVAGDTNGVADIFVHDMVTGKTTRVSVAADGSQSDNNSYYPSISADGRYIAFTSDANNLVSADFNVHSDVFVYDQGVQGQPPTNTPTPIPNATNTFTPVLPTPTNTSIPTSTPVPGTAADLVLIKLELQATTPRVGQPVSVIFDLKNNTAQDITVGRIGIGLRGPDVCDYLNPWTAPTPFDPGNWNNEMIPAGGQREFTKQLNGTSGFVTPGVYIIEPVYVNGTQFTPFKNSQPLWFEVTNSDGSHQTPKCLIVSEPLTISPANPQMGDTVQASFKLLNNTTHPIVLEHLFAAARLGNDWNGVNTDFPDVPKIILQKGSSYTYSQSKIFTERGGYFAEPQRTQTEDGVQYYTGSIWGGNRATFQVTSRITDLGFSPNPNGFGFNNQQLLPSGDKLWSMFEQFFGAENVRKPDGTKCQEAVNYAQQSYRLMANGWSCFGYSMSSAISYLNLPQPNAGIFAIPHFDRLFDLSQSVQLTDPIAYYARTQLSKGVGSDSTTQFDTCKSNSNSPIERIKQGLQNRQPPIVGLFTPKGAHAVLPYRVEELSPTEAYVYIYDSESHGEERHIHFQRIGDDWHWEYTFVGSLAFIDTPQNMGCNNIYLYPLEIALNRGTPPIDFCASSNTTLDSARTDAFTETGQVLINLPPEGDWIVRDSGGHRLGWINGQLISEIPSAYQIPQVLGGEPILYRSLYLPKTEYSVEANNVSTKTISYTLFGDGHMLEVSGQLRSIGSISGIRLDSNLEHGIIYGMQNLSSLVLKFDNEQSTVSRLISITGASVTGSDDFDAHFDGQQLTLSHAGGSLKYTVRIEQFGGQSGTFISAPLSLDANESHTLKPTNWSGLDAADVALEIDRGRDGTVEEMRMLKNQTSAIYLPIILENAMP